MNTLPIIESVKSFGCSKPDIETLAQLISEEALDGNTDPVKLSVQLTALIQVCESAKEKLSEKVLSELDKSNGKAEILGAKIERKETGVKWLYEGSEAWVRVKEQEDKIATKRKSIEAIAKTLTAGNEVSYTDADTGEVMTIIQGIKTSKTSFAITLQK